MLKQRRAAAEKIAKALLASEQSVDGAVAETAALLGAMPVARMEAGISATVGQEAIDRTMEALAALTQARRALVAAHEALHDVQVRIGLREFNFGALGDKPAYPPKEARVAAPLVRLAA